ncbi:MAG TPA: hypothetical protein VE398_05745 [Acidobacteriota bacterium]|nr:hypothetical protein [Acidobacteriota bacterium]
MQKKVSTLAILACTLSLLSVAMPPQMIGDLVNIKFQPDVRVFAVTAAINLAGFDSDARDLVHNPTRKLVLDRLAGVSEDLRERLRNFYREHGEGEDSGRLSSFVSYALLLKGPPQFTLTAKPSELPPEVRTLPGFENLIGELWKQGHLGALWEDVRPDYIREAEAYRPLLRDMIIGTLRYLHTEARVALDRKVVFIPDLLNGFGVVNARNVENDYVVLVGPSRPGGRPLRSLRHEYLHFMIDPLIAKYFADLPAAEPYLKKAGEQPKVRESYQRDFTIMLTESLIQMVELRMDGESGERLKRKIMDAYEQGLVLSFYFEEQLESFEKGHTALQDSYPDMIHGIRWETESRRDAAVAQLKKELESGTSPVANVRAGVPAMPEVLTLLTQANQLLAAKDFDKAAVLLERVLEIDALNASALFGQAQIAAQAQDFERALSLYEEAGANAGSETWIAGWSWVRRGNIYGFLGEMEKARAEWSRVLKLQGNLRGAGEAARKALGLAQE